MKDPYKVLGISKNASDEEVKDAYCELVKKYHPENYDADNPLRDLAKEKMQEVNDAYDEIQRIRLKSGKKSQSDIGSSTNYDYYYANSNSETYSDVRRMINERRFTDAEKALTAIRESDRNAEWHYLASVLLMHRARQNDAMRELEIACNMDPTNLEYQKAKEMFNNSSRGYGSAYQSSATYSNAPQRSSADDACNCCANLICLDCLCECMGGDFISCI